MHSGAWAAAGVLQLGAFTRFEQTRNKLAPANTADLLFCEGATGATSRVGGDNLFEPLSVFDLNPAGFAADFVADAGDVGLDGRVGEGSGQGGHSIRGCVCFPDFFSSTGVG